MNTTFLEVVDNYGIEHNDHTMMSSTHNDHTLDLILAIQADLISNLAAVPGMSENETIVFDVSSYSIYQEPCMPNTFNITNVISLK